MTTRQSTCLHQHQGATYMQASASQQSSVQKPFVSELQAYLQMLTARPKEFGFEDQKCVFLLLAAFRHLYRSQVKEPARTLCVGKAPSAFFKEKVDTGALDQLFISETKKAMKFVG